MNIDTTVENICKEIREGIHMFGEYTYFDKGASEVVDVDKWVKLFYNVCTKEDNPEEVGEILIKIMNKDTEYGEHFVRDVVCNLDNLSDDLWDRLLDYDDKIAQCY